MRMNSGIFHIENLIHAVPSNEKKRVSFIAYMIVKKLRDCYVIYISNILYNRPLHVSVH